MSLVCLDTHILIWGVRNEAAPGQEEMIGRAQRYFDYLDANKDRILIPTVVVSEFLAHTPPEKHAALAQTLLKRFMVVPFDLPASLKAAEIWQSSRQSIVPGLRAEFPDITRAKIRSDILIVASAVARKCDRIVTHDEALIRQAVPHIDAGPMPPLLVQPVLGLPLIK